MPKLEIDVPDALRESFVDGAAQRYRDLTDGA